LKTSEPSEATRKGNAGIDKHRQSYITQKQRRNEERVRCRMKDGIIRRIKDSDNVEQW
jgi:hypothetical protein